MEKKGYKISDALLKELETVKGKIMLDSRGLTVIKDFTIEYVEKPHWFKKPTVEKRLTDINMVAWNETGRFWGTTDDLDVKMSYIYFCNLTENRENFERIRDCFNKNGFDIIKQKEVPSDVY